MGLEDIFDDDELCALFIEFVHKVHSQESFEFWVAVEMYKKILCGEECVKVAKRLFNTYLRKGAEFELTISIHLKEDIRRKIEEGAQVYDQTLFDEAQIAVYNLLTLDCLRSFISTHPKINLTQKFFRVFQPTELSKISSSRLTLTKSLEAFREERKKEKKIKRKFDYIVSSKLLCVC